MKRIATAVLLALFCLLLAAPRAKAGEIVSVYFTAQDSSYNYLDNAYIRVWYTSGPHNGDYVVGSSTAWIYMGEAWSGFYEIGDLDNTYSYGFAIWADTNIYRDDPIPGTIPVGVTPGTGFPVYFVPR